jgi:N-acetylmuramic acid 6-phosphate etherase
MAGGDFALVKSVEGFEDVPAFGRRQLAERGVARGDVVFALTEGGETPFVIGTAWQGLESGARVFFVYDNPDALLCARVPRSREILDEPRIERVNLTTGPMAVTGSTRMQAASIQLLAMLTVLEMVARDLLGSPAPEVPQTLARAFADLHASLASPALCASLARLVEAEEHVYRTGARTSYLASALAVDVLTDTTERSPTFGTPPFRAWDDPRSADPWAFLFTPDPTTEEAFAHLLCRPPEALSWPAADFAPLPSVPRLALADLLRFRIGLDGLPHRPLRPGDGLTAVLGPADLPRLGAFTSLLDRARAQGAHPATIAVGPPAFLAGLAADVALPVPAAPFLLDPLTRLGAKMLLNALSTCVMTRLGRVLGNRMIGVVPSNRKLIDRATRYVRDLARVSYEDACLALFEALGYLEPRRLAGHAVPAPVGLAVPPLRARPFAEAPARLGELLAGPA